MYIGFDTNKITPNVGTQMEGYTPRNSNSIHDDLFESVLYMKNEFKLLFISLDIVAIPGFRADRIKRLILDKYGIKGDQVIIAAIHTHSGPTVTDLLLDNPQIENDYWQYITDQVMGSVKVAIEDNTTCTAELTSSKVNHQAYGNRNVEGAAFNDEILELRFLKSGKIIESILSIATHPTVMNVKNQAITSDLIGQIRKNYQNKYGIKPIIFLSDCGDTSTRFSRRESTFGEVERIASLVTDSLQDDRTSVKKLTDLKIKKIDYICDYNPITSDLAVALWQKINQAYQKDPSQKGILDTYKHIRYYGHTHFKTSAYIYEFSDLRIVCYPGELVNALGKQIRDCDNKKTLLITLANDYRGYSVDKNEFGKYFESYNSVFLKGMADEFISKICQSIVSE